MKIILSPCASNKTTEIELDGLALKVDGQEVDLSKIPKGGEAEGELPLIGKVTREEVTILYKYDAKKAESKQSANADDYVFELKKGKCPCPIRWKDA